MLYQPKVILDRGKGEEMAEKESQPPKVLFVEHLPPARYHFVGLFADSIRTCENLDFLIMLDDDAEKPDEEKVRA